jgi:site-specific DNA recombinase
LTISEGKLKAAVINALKSRLMDPELSEKFCVEYTKHLNQLRIDHNAQFASHEAELRRVNRELEKIVDAIVNGVAISTIKERSHKLEARRIELEGILSSTEQAPVLIHPNMAHRYAVEVKNIITSLNSEEHRIEAAELLRKLIEKIVLTPNDEKTGLVIDLHGDLAGILHIAEAKKPTTKNKTSENLDISRASEVSQVKLVAGARFELTTFRL